MLSPRRSAVAILLVTLACGAAEAQGTAQAPAIRVQQSATVTSEAPVYLLPDNTRTPLRMLPSGTQLTVQRIQGDWLQITFNDAQFGRRTGWIEQRFVRVSAGKPTQPDQVPPPSATSPGTPPAARQQPRQPDPPADRGGLGVRGFGTVTFDRMLAGDSFTAVTEKNTATFFGGGVQVTNITGGLFAEVAAEFTSIDGERVFVLDEEVFRLGIPIEITMRPVDVVVGWRTAPAGRITSYGGGGVSLLKYEETSDFADDEENVSDSHTGFVVMGGVEYRAARLVHVRGEVRYRSFSGAIGETGVSELYDESDLGGFGVALKIAIGR
jgi:opacity protein-like surface antigen